MKDGTLTRDVMYTKARDWAYEKEWRLMVENGNRAIPFQFLSRIIVGCRTPEPEIEEYRKLAANAGVPLFQAVKVPGKFALSLKEVA